MESLLAYGDSDSDEDAVTHDGGPHKRAKLLDEERHANSCNEGQHVVPLQLTRGPSALDGAGTPDWVLPSASEVLGTGADDSVASRNRGRIRSFGHVEGNYATHIYIGVTVPENARQPLQHFLYQVKALFPALEPVLESSAQPSISGAATAAASTGAPAFGTCASHEVNIVQPQYHISLSRTVPIRLSQIDSIVRALKKELRKLDTFRISIGGPEVLINDERTRTFLALSATSATATKGQQQLISRPALPHLAGAVATIGSCGSGSHPLVRAIDAVSRVFQLHGLPRFHADPRPHISVAWLLGDCERQLVATLWAGQGPMQEAAEALAHRSWQTQADKIYCRTGQKLFVIWEAK